jgi:hypothetical protein
MDQQGIAMEVLYPNLGWPVQYDETPASPRRAAGVAAHTEEILLELGFAWEDILT